MSDTNGEIPGPLGFFQGKSPVSQVILGVVLAIIIYITLFSLEAV